MAQEMREPQTLQISDEDRLETASSSSQSDPSLSRNASFSRLNARAPEFVPRTAAAPPAGNRGVKIHHHPHQHQHHHHQPPPPPVMHVVYHPSPPPAVSPQFAVPAPGHGLYHHHHHHHDYYGEHEADLDQMASPPPPSPKDGLSEEVTQKITKQVEYYFSDLNLATTEHLMKFITKDPEGYVPITVIASFKKIKALVHNNSLLADALRTSSKLVVSEDGKKIRRQQPFTESDVEELQSRIVVAENLPEDHCYQSLMKVFSIAGSVKTIRTCYPQTPNGTTTATNRSSKMDMLFSNKLHAFVEYETVDDAEKAVIDLNDERNWRSGLRVRLLSSCMVPLKQGQPRVRKPGHEVDGNLDEEASPPKVKQVEQDPHQSAETSFEQMGEELSYEKESGPARRGKGRGRGGGGGRGRGRGQLHINNNNNNSYNYHRGGGHSVGTPPSSHPIHNEASAATRPPPGPRMPDGTRGFTMGRGKSLPATSTSAA